MKKAFIWGASVIGMAAVFALVFGALERRGNTLRTISVSGECLTTAPRDKTAITLRVSVLQPNASESMRLATTRMSEITERLKSLPVELQTTQFNSYEKSEWNREIQKNQALGIETTVAVEISASSIDVIEQALSYFAGATDVYTENLRMYTSPETMQPIIERCMSVAVENARTRANALASGDNKRAGRMLSVSYGTVSNDSVSPAGGLLRNKMVMASSVADGAIVSRDSDVSVTVSAVFEIN